MEMTTYENGAPCWIDLMTADRGKAIAFYTGLFGWTEGVDAGPDAISGTPSWPRCIPCCTPRTAHQANNTRADHRGSNDFKPAPVGASGASAEGDGGRPGKGSTRVAG